MPNQRYSTFVLQSNLIVAFVGGLFVLWAYLSEPSEPNSAVFLGFSFLRLILIVAVISLLLTILGLLVSSFRKSWQTQAVEEKFIKLAHQKGMLLAVIVSMTTSYVLLFSSEQLVGFLASYRERLLPILVWFAALSIQLGFIVLYLRGINPLIFREYRGVLLSSLTVLILFGFLLLLITVTRLGLKPDAVYWQGPGVPILLYQVLLALFAGVLFYFFVEKNNPRSATRLDLVVFLSLWGLACLLWLSQPAKPTYFSLEPRSPNFQTYPFSDALLYDSTAQQFLIGQPIPGDFWVKPLYSLFLALLHLFSGNNYGLLVSLQVVILAIIPSFVYLLTGSFDKRAAGIVAALLLILRERNAIALSNIIQVSHSKLLLSDVFAMGEMIILTWLAVRWLQRPVERRAMPIAVGGMLGLLILTRGHPVLIFPFLFLIGFMVLRSNLKLWYESSLRIVLGLSLVLLPWFWHIYQLTGKIGFQDASSRYAQGDWLVQAYSQPLDSVPGSEKPPSYEQFQSRVFRYFFEHPLEVAGFVSAHYFHNAIFSYIYLPQSFQIESLHAYVTRLPFWGAWDGSVPPEAGLLMVLNLAVLSLGIGTVWKQENRLIWTPLILGSAYNLSLAVSRRSGWRFILPADWVTLIFYAIGLLQVVVVLQSLARPAHASSESSTRQPDLTVFGKPVSVTFALLFFLIAILLVQGHHLFPSRYPAENGDGLLQAYQSGARLTSSAESAALKDFLQKDQAVIVQGKALYPVYLNADEGMLNYYWLSYSSRPYSRVAFYLIGSQSTGIILPMESPPPAFPDGAEVIVIGCLAKSGEINALEVLIEGSAPIRYISEPFPKMACPVSEPG